MGHDHSHGHGHHGPDSRAGSRHQQRLAICFALLLVVMAVEVITALLTGSLALLSDGGHMLTDVVGMGMALAAIRLANRGSTASHRTFGWYRLEILAALANAILLTAVGVYVVVEAILRIGDPVDVHVAPTLIIASVGLGANLVAFVLLRPGAQESLNVRGVYLEMLADTLGSVGVIVATVVLWFTGSNWVDPVAAIVIGVFVFPRTAALGAQAVRILVQAAPAGVDPDVVLAQLRAIPGVVDVHDLHIWTLTSEMDVASAHLRIADDADGHGVLDAASALLRDTYGLGHATLQVEPIGHEGCDSVSW